MLKFNAVEKTLLIDLAALKVLSQVCDPSNHGIKHFELLALSLTVLKRLLGHGH